VDFLIFLKNKIFLSIFWLKIWWDVVRLLNHLFCSFVGFVSVDWQKSGLNRKKLKSMVFVPLDHPPNKVSTFLIIITMLRPLPTFLFRKFISNVFGLSSMGV